MNPWSALLNGGMLAQGRSGGNGRGGSRAVAQLQGLVEKLKTALRFSLLDLGSSRVREKSGRPGDLRRMAWEPAGSFRVAGALTWNLPSMKISAASGSEVMVSWP